MLDDDLHYDHDDYIKDENDDYTNNNNNYDDNDDDESFKSALEDLDSSLMESFIDYSLLSETIPRKTTVPFNELSSCDNDYNYDDNNYDYVASPSSTLDLNLNQVINDSNERKIISNQESNNNDDDDKDNNNNNDNGNEMLIGEELVHTKTDLIPTYTSSHTNSITAGLPTTSVVYQHDSKTKYDTNITTTTNTINTTTRQRASSETTNRSQITPLSYATHSTSSTLQHHNNNHYPHPHDMMTHTPKLTIINSISFNQDHDCIALATNTGYRIMTLHPPIRIHKCSTTITSNDNKHNGVILIKQLHKTSLLALVYANTPRIVYMVHAKNAKPIQKFSFSSAIRRVEMNLQNMVVLTSDGMLHVFAFFSTNTSSSTGGHNNNKTTTTTITSSANSTTTTAKYNSIQFLYRIPILHSTESTRIMNSNIVSSTGTFFDLSSHTFGKSSFLVTKCKDGVGFVSVYNCCYGSNHSVLNGNTTSSYASSRKSGGGDSIQQQPILVGKVRAHHQGIQKITIGGNDGFHPACFATASVKGTIIRVYSLPDCQKLYGFQRGQMPSTIYSMSFNPSVTFFAVTSNKGTLHIFRCSSYRDSKSKMSWLHSIWPTSKKSHHHGHQSTSIEHYDDNNNNNVGSEIVDRSFCKIRLIKHDYTDKQLGSNIISMMDATDPNDEVQVSVCLQNGHLLQFGIRNGKYRPILSEAILLE